MKRFASYFLYTLLLAAIVCASFSCNHDDLDILTHYSFDWTTMPVQTKIVQGETAEIRCRIIKEGEYKETTYSIRYFQPSGRGELRLDDGRILLPNDLYPLTKDVFRLYYTSLCTDQQMINVYIEDNYGQVVQKSFSFTNESTGDESKKTGT
jgi:hypothetical protein